MDTVQKITTPSNSPRPKLSLRKAPSTISFYFCWVVGRRGPRVRYATSAEALTERARLREMGLDAHAYAAHLIEDAK